MGLDKDRIGELIHKAQAALHQKHPQEARELFFQALEVAPDHPDAHYGLATISFQQGDVLAAAHHFREVTRHDPTRAGAFVNLGAIYNHLGRHHDAIATLNRGILLDPNRGEGFYNLGLVMRKLGRTDEAAAAYLEAVRLQPGLGEAHFNLANIMLDAERFAEAIVQYRDALKSRANWPAAQQGLKLAEEALRGKSGSAPVSAPAAVDESKLTRTVDPHLHGVLLAEVHRAADEAEAIGKNLGGEIMHQMDNALKELATCFLRPDTPGYAIAKKLEGFEAAASRVKSLHAELETLRGKTDSYEREIDSL